MKQKLWMVRIKAFFIELAGILLASLGAFLASPELATILTELATEHFGGTALVTAIVLAVIGALKNMSNLNALKKAESLGSLEGNREPVILI